MGIHEGPAPDDIVGLYSIPVGSSGAARFGEHASHGLAELEHLITRYMTIDRYLPPWTRDWVP